MDFLFIDHNGVCYLYLLLHHPIYFPLIGSAHLEIKLGVVQGIAHGLFTMRKWLSFYEKVAWFLLIPTLGTSYSHVGNNNTYYESRVYVAPVF